MPYTKKGYEYDKDYFSSDRMTGAGLGGSTGNLWGAGIGYTVGAEYEEYKKWLDQGYNTGDYAAYRFFGWEPDKTVLENLSPTNSLNVLGNLLDPFGDISNLFGGGGDEGEKKIAGKTQSEWVESLGMSDDEYQNYLTELVQTISTGSAESRNKFSEIAAMNRLPAATQLAAERGVQIRANEAAQEGEERLTRMREDINRQAEMTAMQMFAAKESQDENYARMQEQQTQQSMNSLLNMLGQYIGEKYFTSDPYNEIPIGNTGEYWDATRPGTTRDPYQLWQGQNVNLQGTYPEAWTFDPSVYE